jgi:hypothetical protein
MILGFAFEEYLRDAHSKILVSVTSKEHILGAKYKGELLGRLCEMVEKWVELMKGWIYLGYLKLINR